ncbi:MAG: DUF2853 family protein [Cocleimonas sp.]|nr:DUF2853 family protein [Cocleimonas sp.]
MADLASAVANVKKFDSGVNEALVEAIFNSLKPVHENKDAMLVSCGDESELNTVKTNFLIKKLGLDDSPALDAAVKETCETVKEDHMKARITFYYLLTKKFGKESVYGV